MEHLSLALAPGLDTHPRSSSLLSAMADNGVDADLLDMGQETDAVGALVRGEARLALVPVNVSATPPAGVRWAAVPTRAEPRDVLVPAGGAPATLRNLAPGTRVGVGGSRRWRFLRAHRPDVEAVALVNGGGPAAALTSGSVDVVILGSAEARRSLPGWHATEVLDPRAWVPAACQGTVVLLAREDDEKACRAVSCVDDASTRAAVAAECAVVDGLGVGANAPLGALALPHGPWIRLWGMVASPDGRSVVRGDVTGPRQEPRQAGQSLAELLLARGARELLEGSIQ